MFKLWRPLLRSGDRFEKFGYRWIAFWLGTKIVSVEERRARAQALQQSPYPCFESYSGNKPYHKT